MVQKPKILYLSVFHTLFHTMFHVKQSHYLEMFHVKQINKGG